MQTRDPWQETGPQERPGFLSTITDSPFSFRRRKGTKDKREKEEEQAVEEEDPCRDHARDESRHEHGDAKEDPDEIECGLGEEKVAQGCRKRDGPGRGIPHLLHDRHNPANEKDEASDKVEETEQDAKQVGEVPRHDAGVDSHGDKDEADQDKDPRASERSEGRLPYRKDLDGHDDEQKPKLAVGREREDAQVDRDEQNGKQRKEHAEKDQQRGCERKGDVPDKEESVRSLSPFFSKFGLLWEFPADDFDAPGQIKEGCSVDDKENGSEWIGRDGRDEREDAKQERHDIHERAGNGEVPEYAGNTEPEGCLLFVKNELDQKDRTSENEDGTDQYPNDP